MRVQQSGTWPGRSADRVLLSAATALSLLLAACGGSATATTSTSASASAPVTSAVSVASSSASLASSSSAVTTSAAPTSTTASSTTTASNTASATPTTAGAAATSSAADNTGITTKLTGAPVPLVVYSAQGYDSDVVKAFQAATGIPTKLVDDSTGPLLAKVAAEKNNPQWGVLWVDGDEAFASLDQQGQLLKGFEPADANWTTLGSSVVPKDQSYIPADITIAGTVVYDSKSVTDPPKTWADLLLPQWKGVVGMNNPAVSGPTFPFVAGMMVDLGGEQQGKAFYQKLKANGLQVFQTNGDTLQALENGKIKVAMIQSSAGIGAQLKVPTIKTAFLSKSALLPGVVGIDAHVSPQEQTEAKMFAEYVLSPAGQQVMLKGDPSGDSLFWPVVQGVNPLPALPAIADLPTEVVDPYVWGPKEAEINTWFSQNIAQ